MDPIHNQSSIQPNVVERRVANDNSILDSLKSLLQEKMSQINQDVKSKLNEVNKNIVDKGINIVEQRLGDYKVIGFALYIIPVILLFYIIYLLNKYH